MEVEAEVYCELQIPVYLRGCLQGAGFILGKGVVVMHVGGVESRFLLAQVEQALGWLLLDTFLVLVMGGGCGQ